MSNNADLSQLFNTDPDETPVEDQPTPEEQAAQLAQTNAQGMAQISLTYFHYLIRGGLTREEALALTRDMQRDLMRLGHANQ